MELVDVQLLCLNEFRDDMSGKKGGGGRVKIAIITIIILLIIKTCNATYPPCWVFKVH